MLPPDQKVLISPIDVLYSKDRREANVNYRADDYLLTDEDKNRLIP